MTAVQCWLGSMYQVEFLDIAVIHVEGHMLIARLQVLSDCVGISLQHL